MTTYLDTSLLVSLYVVEKHTADLVQYIIKDSENLSISQLVETEFYSALAMKKRMKELTTKQFKMIIEKFQSHMDQLAYQRVHISNEVFDKANSYLVSGKFSLRTLDALHLACASVIEAKLLTADVSLAKSAKEFNVPVKCI